MGVPLYFSNGTNIGVIVLEALLEDEDYVGWILDQPDMLQDLQARYPAFGQLFTEILNKEERRHIILA